MSPTNVNNLPHALRPNTSAPTVTLTIAGTAATLATLGLTLHADTKYVMVAIESYAVRTCPEGGTPTSSLGIKVPADQVVILSRDEAAAAKWIRITSSATAQVAQYTE